MRGLTLRISAKFLADYMNKLDQLHEHRGSIVGVPTGFTDLDRLTGGLQKSDLLVLAARPGIGKTSMALSIAHNSAVKYQRSVAVFSLEMSKEQLAQRLLSMDAGIDQQRLRTGWIEDDEWDRIVVARDTLEEASIWIDDTASISTTELRSKARRLQAQEGIDLIIIDYLQLMQATIGGKRNENRVQEISEISRSLKALARELNVPVLALAQLSRAVESRQSKVPQLSDLRESGCLTGDTLVFLPDSGTYKPIEQLVSLTGFKTLALNTETWKLEPREVTKAFSTGYKPVYKMTTRLGRSIRATANHQFLTIHGWQRLDTLSVGTRIALPRHLEGSNDFCQPNRVMAGNVYLRPVGTRGGWEDGWGLVLVLVAARFARGYTRQRGSPPTSTSTRPPHPRPQHPPYPTPYPNRTRTVGTQASRQIRLLCSVGKVYQKPLWVTYIGTRSYQLSQMGKPKFLI